MKKIWLCPRYGSASKRNANIKRHGITVHGETVVPVGYDPLLQKLSGNEQVTYHAQEDSLPFFFHLENKDNKMSKDTANNLKATADLADQDTTTPTPPQSLANNLKATADLADQDTTTPTPLESLANNLKATADLAEQDTATPTPLESIANNLKAAADLADQFDRLKKSSLFSGVSSSGSNHLVNFPRQNLTPVTDNVIYKPTFFTAYVCPRCATGILMPWSGLITAQAVHERSCKGKTSASNTDTAKIQSIKDSQVNHIISAMESIYPSKKYVKCLAIDEIATFAIKLFNLVELEAVTGDHWIMRAYHDQKTEINREEMREFITIASANIAIFKAKLNTHLGYYLMSISG